MSECPPGVHSMFDPCPGDCGEFEDSVMNAAGDFADALGYTGAIEWPALKALEVLLNEHAHELAEKIRAETTSRTAFPSEGARAMAAYGRRLADLIDPEVTG